MAASCGNCRSRWKAKDTIVCFRCGGDFHTLCCSDKEVLSDNIIELIKKENNSIRWFCSSCDDVHSELKEVKQKMMENHQMQLEILRKIELKCESFDNSSIKTYANVVKKVTNDPVVMIKPKKDQKVKITKDVLREKVDPTKIPVNGLLNAAKGSLLVKCKNNDGANTAQEEIKTKMGEDYDVYIPEQRNPRVKILNVFDDPHTDPATFMGTIVKQNKNIIGDISELRYITIEKNKNQTSSKNLIFEVSPSLFKKIMNEKYLNVFWRRCLVVESIHIARCFRCGEFGHICKSTNSNCEKSLCCPKCSMEHTIGECKSKFEKCSNCVKHNNMLNLNLKTDHKAWDRNCPVYQRKIKMKQRSINYINY